MKINVKPMEKIKLKLREKLSAKERWVMIKQRFKRGSDAIKLEKQIDEWDNLTYNERAANRKLRLYRTELAKCGKNICFGPICHGQIMSSALFSKDINTCKKCYSNQIIMSYKRNNGQSYQRTIFLLKQGKVCETCGCDDPVVLDFDHINREDKLSTISRTNSTKRILEEVKKTRLLCVMCHRLHTETQWKTRTISYESDFVNKVKMEIGKCTDCEIQVSVETLVCFDFDHMDQSTKLSNISTLVSKHATINAIKEEISKCELRCASCHRLKTAKQLNYPMSHKPVIKLLKPKLIEYCIDCNNSVIRKGAQRCENCARMDNRKVKDRPSFEELRLDFMELKSYVAVGKKYGVTDNAIKKWIEIAERDMTLEDRQRDLKCVECKSDIRRGYVYCAKCQLGRNRKVEFKPNLDQLNDDLKELKTYVAVGGKYGVHADVIRYHMKK